MSRRDTIGITAASGQLGLEIVKATVAMVGKENVVGLARNRSKAESPGVEVHPGDYSARHELTESLQGIDSLLSHQSFRATGERKKTCGAAVSGG